MGLWVGTLHRSGLSLRPIQLKATLSQEVRRYSSFSWAPFAIHSLAEGPQPGYEGGTGSVIGSSFVDLEGNVDFWLLAVVIWLLKPMRPQTCWLGAVGLPALLGRKKERTVFGIWQQVLQWVERFELVPDQGTCGKVRAISHHMLALLEQQ